MGNIVMNILKLEMSEHDIVKAIKNVKYTPLHYLASRIFKEILDNIDIQLSGILIWDDELNDYTHYKYCTEDIDKINNFLEYWNDFIDEKINQFNESPLSFCVEKLK